MAKPTVFIGSSSERRALAEALVNVLGAEGRCLPVPWWQHQGFEEPNSTNLRALEKAALQYDFAALILTPDDRTIARGENVPSYRDNLAFEHGLFLGAMGRDRVFFLRERGVTLRIPSDLLGILPIEFEPPQRGGSPDAAEDRVRFIRPGIAISKEVERLGGRFAVSRGFVFHEHVQLADKHLSVRVAFEDPGFLYDVELAVFHVCLARAPGGNQARSWRRLRIDHDSVPQIQSLWHIVIPTDNDNFPVTVEHATDLAAIRSFAGNLYVGIRGIDSSGRVRRGSKAYGYDRVRKGSFEDVRGYLESDDFTSKGELNWIAFGQFRDHE